MALAQFCQYFLVYIAQKVFNDIVTEQTEAVTCSSCHFSESVDARARGLICHFVNATPVKLRCHAWLLRIRLSNQIAIILCFQAGFDQ